MTQVGCEEKQRLLIAYDEASSELSDAVATLRKNEGTTSKEEYDSLCRGSEDAHLLREQACFGF